MQGLSFPGCSQINIESSAELKPGTKPGPHDDFRMQWRDAPKLRHVGAN